MYLYLLYCSDDEDDKYEIVRQTKSVGNKGMKRKATDEAVQVNKKAREN